MADTDIPEFILSFFRMDRLVKTEERKIRKALEDAKKRSARWARHVSIPAVSADGLIAPLDVKHYLTQCLEPVENGLIEMAQRFSPVEWLWYLRRFPYIHYIEDESFENYCLTLAAILSARSKRKDNTEEFDTLLEFPLTHAIANQVLAFVASVYDLGDLHIKYGVASREVPFKNMGKRLPEPVFTPIKKKAGVIFDARQGGYSLIGTIPNHSDEAEESPFLVLDKVYHPIAMRLPYYDIRGRETPALIPTRYIPRQLPLKHISDVYKLTNNGNGQWLTYEVFSLLLLTGLLLPIAASSPEHSINIAMYGYSVHERSDFVMDYWPVVEDRISIFKELFPEAVFPNSFMHFIALLNDMEKVKTDTRPLLPGVFLGDDHWIIVDHENVKNRLETLLRFPNLDDATGKQRGTHFEDAIQSYIDASSWKPSDALRSLRQVHLLRPGERKNDYITDIDAIGESGNILLIISCKAVVFSVGQDIGEYFALKNARLRLDEAVLKWQAVKGELLASPIGQNYDLSRYSKIIAIVCTPTVVYTESELSLSYEVAKVRKAATAPEFIDWLRS